MAHKVFAWRMAGERKQPETRPSFYWVMDIFSKEPSRAALLKVTELTLSTDNINGIVDISVSSFIFFPLLLNLFFFYASEAYEWLKSTRRVSDACCGCKVEGIKWDCMKLIYPSVIIGALGSEGALQWQAWHDVADELLKKVTLHQRTENNSCLAVWAQTLRCPFSNGGDACMWSTTFGNKRDVDLDSLSH